MRWALLRWHVLIDPVESSWEILKSSMLKAALGKAPDENEKELIADLLRCENGLEAEHILNAHRHDEHMFLRLYEIIRNYTPNWELASKSGFKYVGDKIEYEEEPIISAVKEDNTAFLNPRVWNEIERLHTRLGEEHYKRYEKTNAYETSKNWLALKSQQKPGVKSAWAQRAKELAEIHPHQFDDSKAAEVKTLQRSIDAKNNHWRTQRAIELRMRKRPEEDRENIEREVYRQNELKVLKQYYHDHACADIIRDMSNFKLHDEECPNKGGSTYRHVADCDCPYLLGYDGSTTTSADSRMGDRSDMSGYGNLEHADNVHNAMRDITGIIMSSPQVPQEIDGKLDSRYHRLTNYWKSLEPEVRMTILGCQIDFGSTVQPLLPIFLHNWKVGKSEREDLMGEIARFEGEKSALASRGLGDMKDPSIIGRWGSRELYRYLTEETRPSAPPSQEIGDFDSLEVAEGGQASTGGQGVYAGEPDKEERDDIEPDSLEAEDYFEGPAEGGPDDGAFDPRPRRTVSGKPPFPTHTIRSEVIENKDRYDSWVEDLHQRVDDSTGKNALSPSNPRYLTKDGMERKLAEHSFVNSLFVPFTKGTQEHIFKQSQEEFSKKREDKSRLYDESARSTGISPALLLFAQKQMAYDGTPEGKRFYELRRALFDSYNNRRDDNFILESAAGKKAIAERLGTRRDYRGRDKTEILAPSIVDCPACGATGEVKKHPRSKRMVQCRRCKGRKQIPGADIKAPLSDKKKVEIIQGFDKEYEQLQDNLRRNITGEARRAGFTTPCTDCIDDKTGQPTGKDQYLGVDCMMCDGEGEYFNEKRFINKVLHGINVEGQSTKEVLDGMAKSLERYHSTIRNAQRKEQHARDLAMFVEYGILPNGTHILLHKNDLHTEFMGKDGQVRGGMLRKKNLMDLRRRIILENPDAKGNEIRDKIGQSLSAAFNKADENHGHLGFFLRDAVHSPWFEELCEMLSYDKHLPDYPEAIEQRVKNHLGKINNPGRFDTRSSAIPCGVCHGKGWAREKGTGNYKEGVNCPACVEREYLGDGQYLERSTGIQRYSKQTMVPAVTDNHLMRDGTPACHCCGNGHNQRVSQGLGIKSKVFHNPSDINSEALILAHEYRRLHDDIVAKMHMYLENPTEDLKSQIEMLNLNLEDLVMRESNEFNAALGSDYGEALDKHRREGFSDFGTGKAIEESMGTDDEMTPENTHCPFCMNAAKSLDPPMLVTGSTSLDVPYLGDEDGYHNASGIGRRGQGCPNDPQNEDGQTIYQQLVEYEMLPPELQKIQDASWARGPFLDEIQDKDENFDTIMSISPEQKAEWEAEGKDFIEEYRKMRQGRRREKLQGPRRRQHVGDLDFAKYAALRRRSQRPTPQELFTHKFHSRYFDSNAHRDTLPGMSEYDRENYTDGEAFLDKIEREDILEPENDDELRRLYAIHILAPDYLVGTHGNPLYLTAGETNIEELPPGLRMGDEKSMQDWARKTLGLDKGEKINSVHRNELKTGLHLIAPLLVAEKEWKYHYLGPRAEWAEEHGWPESIFNISDSSEPFIIPENIERVFGELKGHYRDCQDSLMYGHYSPDHHGFMPTTEHFPDMALFLNNRNMPVDIAQAWIDHHPGLDDPEHELYQKTNGLMATKGKTLEEMRWLANSIFGKLTGRMWELGDKDIFPLSLEDLVKSYGDGESVEHAMEDAWERVHDMLMRRSTDPEGSKRALRANMPIRNRSNLNPWGYATACNACDGIGHMNVEDFVHFAPAFIDFRTSEGERSYLALDSAGRPIISNGEIHYGDPRVLQFFRDNARPHTHKNWEDHPNFDADNPTWFVDDEHMKLQCPACEGTHVCSGCDGHGGVSLSEREAEKLHMGKQFLAGQSMECWGIETKLPTKPFEPTELIVNPANAKINQMPEEITGDYVDNNSLLSETRPRSTGRLYFEERDDEGNLTGMVYSIRDPWYSETGGMGSTTPFDKRLEKMTANEFWGAGGREKSQIGPPPQEGWGVPAGSEAQDRKLEGLKDSMDEWGRYGTSEPEPPLLEEGEKPKPTEWEGGKKPVFGECGYPGCSQIIPTDQKYCGATRLREHTLHVGGGKQRLELQETDNEAPNHAELMKSPRMQEALGYEIPSRQYYGGMEGVQRMLALGFNMVGTIPYGTVPHSIPENEKDTHRVAFRDKMRGLTAEKFIELRRLKRQYQEEQPDVLRKRLKNGDINKKEYEHLMKTRLDEDGLEKKREELEEEWDEILNEGVQEYMDSFPQLDMHIPYFTHPDIVDEHSGQEIPHTPMDLGTHTGAIPHDISTLMYIPHGFDPTNPQHGTKVSVGETNLYLKGVYPQSVCPQCFMKLSRDDVEEGRCPSCFASFSEPNRDYINPSQNWGGLLNMDGLNWIASALDNRGSLRARAESVAKMGGHDPALIKCPQCQGEGVYLDRENNPVQCNNCVALDDGHYCLGDSTKERLYGGGEGTIDAGWDKYAIVQYHRPNYHIVEGFEGDDSSFKPIKGDALEKAVHALRLSAGGSGFSLSMLAAAGMSGFSGGEGEAPEISNMTSVQNKKLADKAEHQLRALLDPNTLVPTMNSGFFSGNHWKHPTFKKARFKGYRSAQKMAQDITSLLAAGTGGGQIRELFRITGARSFADLGSPGPAESKGRLPDWKPSPFLKKRFASAKKTIDRLGKKRQLNDNDKTRLRDARMLLSFDTITDEGEPIALLNKQQTGNKVYRLEIADPSQPGMIRDIPLTMGHGSFLTSSVGDGRERAQRILDGNLGPKHGHMAVKDGVMGTAGEIFAAQMDNLDKRADGHFKYSSGGKEEGTFGIEEPLDMASKDVLFTPAAFHDETIRAHNEGRLDHAESYNQRLHQTLGGLGIDLPTLPERGDDRGILSTEEAGQITGPSLPTPPPAVWDDDDEVQTGEPMSLAWDEILKNIEIIR